MSTSNLNNNFDFSISGPQLLQVPQPENLNAAPDLMKHPFVMDLFRRNLELQASHLKLGAIHSRMVEFHLSLQNNLLRQVSSLETELSAAKQKVSTLTAELQSLQVNPKS